MVTNPGSKEAWGRYLIMPSCCLRKPTRAGKKVRASLGSTIQQQINAFNRGEYTLPFQSRRNQQALGTTTTPNRLLPNLTKEISRELSGWQPATILSCHRLLRTKHCSMRNTLLHPQTKLHPHLTTVFNFKLVSLKSGERSCLLTQVVLVDRRASDHNT